MLAAISATTLANAGLGRITVSGNLLRDLPYPFRHDGALAHYYNYIFDYNFNYNYNCSEYYYFCLHHPNQAFNRIADEFHACITSSGPNY